MPSLAAVIELDESQDGAIEVALDEWPVVVIRMPCTIALEVIVEVGRTVDGLIERNEEFALVIDHRFTDDMPAVARKAIASWEKARSASLRTSIKAMALVMPNRTMFAVASLVGWLNPPPYPKRCFLPGELMTAKAWAREKMAGGATLAPRWRR